MIFRPKHGKLLKNEKILRWWDNKGTRYHLSIGVSLRNIGHYCEINETSPKEMLDNTKSWELKKQFSDFVRRILLIPGEIRKDRILAVISMHPYVLRAFFSTILNIGESKDLISHQGGSSLWTIKVI